MGIYDVTYDTYIYNIIRLSTDASLTHAFFGFYKRNVTLSVGTRLKLLL